MDYDIEGVKSIKMDQDAETIIIDTGKEKRTLTREEIETVTLKEVAFMEGDTYYFNNGRCSISKERKELMCGD